MGETESLVEKVFRGEERRCEGEAQDEKPQHTTKEKLEPEPSKGVSHCRIPILTKDSAKIATDVSTSHVVTIASNCEDSPSVVDQRKEEESPQTPRAQDSSPESSGKMPSKNKFPSSIAFVKDKEEQGLQGSSFATSTSSNMGFVPSLKRKVSNVEQDAPANKVPKTAAVTSPSSLSRSCVEVPIAPKPLPTLLLARPNDTLVLSGLHSFIRQQIEVFSATARDISQPAPGRKNPVALQQIGLRCIHCRDLPLKQRVKRAVCYPSTVGRVYHSVSDMKHDHFKACPCMPPDVHKRFMELRDEKNKPKAEKKASKATGCSSSTAQYYHDAALQMGMRDGKGGVFWSADKGSSPTKLSDAPAAPMESNQGQAKSSNPSIADHTRLPDYKDLIAQLNACQQLSLPSEIASALGVQQNFLQRTIQEQILLGLLAKKNLERNSSLLLPKPPAREESKEKSKSSSGTTEKAPKLSGWPVSCPLDEQYLNPIHCFVRRHVEFFVAGEEDVKAPSPGRKVRAVLGQVGIRCIHCARLSPKNRVKRSICYPPSIGGIYHAVSNIKCDHFALCKGLPEADKQEFLRLRCSGTRKTSSSSSGKQSKSDRGFANSTAQYYHDSALRMGLIDTADGIRFTVLPAANKPDEPTKPEEQVRPALEDTKQSPAEESEEGKGGMAALMAATDLVAAAEMRPTGPVTAVASL